MPKISVRTLFPILLFGICACSVNKPVVSNSGSDQLAADYIARYKDLSVSEMNRTGIPASITLAQGMIESDYGRSRLAREANNHFGIKCHNGWKGPAIRHHDDKRNECFRKYRKPEESFQDHSEFIKSGSRYSFLFDIKQTDYKAWARGLKKAGYATNPDYANMLIRKIEEHNLSYFDRGYNSSVKIPKRTIPEKIDTVIYMEGDNMNNAAAVNDSFSVTSHVSRIMENNRIQYIIVKEGDTRANLEKEFQLLGWELSRYNELENEFSLYPGQILYLQPKREKAEPGKEFHICVAGDTMYLISQRYGIKLKSLYEMNRLDAGTEPVSGSRIWLRGIKSGY